MYKLKEFKNYIQTISVKCYRKGGTKNKKEIEKWSEIVKITPDFLLNDFTSETFCC